MGTLNFEQLQQNLQQKPQTWLITGVAGFIGSNLLKELLMLNQKVVGIDNFLTGYKHNLDDVLESVTPAQKKNFKFYKGDICNIDDCHNAMENADYVLHQAALGSVPRSIDTPELTNQNNVAGSLNVFIAAKDVRVKRVIYASSSSVYGDSPILPREETHLGNPLSPYAASKHAVELYAKAFSACYPLEIIGLRYFNVFGPRQNPNGPYAAVIPKWLTSLLNNETIDINGDGKASRDFCYVANVVQANLLAATTQRPEAINTLYNIAVGEQITLNELADFLIKAVCPNSESNRLKYGPLRAGDVPHSLANIAKAQNTLGYFPQWKVNAGLTETVRWFSSKHMSSSNTSKIAS